MQSYDSSNVCFNTADYFIETTQKSLGDVSKSYLLNPMMQTYLGESFERLMIHYYKSLNYLALNKTDDAIVEARRITLSNNALSDQQTNKKKYNKNISQKINQLRLQPYSFVSKFKKLPSTITPYILFFGQLSYYKGIDLLLEAIPKVLAHYPDEHFIIAGKSNGFILDRKLLDQYPQHITFIDNYLSIEQLSHLIHGAKFVVCPYREATQSGVLMTAFAMGKTVLATNMGAFPEYISDGINGMLTNANPNSIAKAIGSMLESNHYLDMEKNIVQGYSTVDSIHNSHALMQVYHAVETVN